MALSKTSRVMSLPPGAASKLLPPEVIKMAGQVKAAAGGMINTKGSNLKDPSGKDLYAKLTSKTKGRNFDQDKNLVHKKSSLDYIPPKER